jgi:hypothetical protein
MAKRVARTLMVLLALAGSLVAATPRAFAFECFVADKPTGAGSLGTVNFTTGTFTPIKPNPFSDGHLHGAFVTATNGSTFTRDLFVNAPTKARAPFAEPSVIPGATKQESMGKGCDGKGLDDVGACQGH